MHSTMRVVVWMCVRVVALVVAVAFDDDHVWTEGDGVYYQDWRTRTSMPEPRSDTGISTNYPYVYISGGCTKNQTTLDGVNFFCPNITKICLRYDLSADKWTELPPMPRERYRHAHAGMYVGSSYKIFLFGGRDLTDVIIPEVDVYDTSTNTWSEVGEWPEATSDAQAVVLYNEQLSDYYIYVVGGYHQNYSTSNSTWLYAHSTSTFTAVASMLIPRGDHGLTAVGSYGYVLGGYNTDFCSPLSEVERFDPNANDGIGEWTAVSSMSRGRGDMAVAVLNGRLYAVGGEENDATTCFVTPIQNVEAYVVSEDTWVSVIEIPEQRFRYAGASYVDGVYIFGGQGYFNNQSNIYPLLNGVSEYREVQILNAASTSQLSSCYLFGTLALTSWRVCGALMDRF